MPYFTIFLNDIGKTLYAGITESIRFPRILRSPGYGEPLRFKLPLNCVFLTCFIFSLAYIRLTTLNSKHLRLLEKRRVIKETKSDQPFRNNWDEVAQW